MDDKTNDISNFILNSSESAVPDPSSFADSGSSFADKIRSISVTTWIIIIFVLAFLGINIFVYLAKGTQTITDFLKPITDIFTKLFGSVSSQIVDVTAEGAKAVIETTASTVNAGLTGVQKLTPGGSNIKDVIPQPDIMKTNTMNRALNSTKQTSSGNNQYKEDDTTSNIQKSAGKAGWCYIGTDSGVRSCAQVGINDDCLSGDIFSTNDICVNPNLRA
jgi:hypothetical protein